jgi:cation transport protein ChaC
VDTSEIWMDTGEIWVFGYGSLMWNPGFEHLEAAPALLRGYHRDFCIYSHRHRGTPERPGLVLGLAPGGSCRGMAFRIAGGRARAALAYLHEREMGSYVYDPRRVPITVGGRRVSAHTYVADVKNANFGGKQAPARAAAIIAAGRGESGRNIDYLESTIAHLATMGFEDARLARLLALTRETGGG